MSVKSSLVRAGVVAAFVGVTGLATTSVANATPYQTNCVDASQLNNLVYPAPGSDQWVVNGNKITGKIGLKNNKPACKDTTIYVSSYTMPDTWDQKSFPATALPQTFIESQSVTFKANQASALTSLTVSFPVPCKNVQVDMYYGPEKKILDEQGHNGVYISHKFIKRDNEACKPRVTPGAPSVNDVCGTDKDKVTIPATEGVSYQLNGKAVTAGEYPATGTVTVTARAANSQYVIANGATTTWTFTLTNEACPTPGQGGGTVETPKTPETPQILAASTTVPTTLPATGSVTSQVVTIAAALAAFAFGATYMIRAKLAAVRNR